jgi:hypothetical protein
VLLTLATVEKAQFFADHGMAPGGVKIKSRLISC